MPTRATTCRAPTLPSQSCTGARIAGSSPILPRALGQRLMVRAELRVVDAPVDHVEWASVAVLSAVPPALGAPHDLNIVVIVVAHLCLPRALGGQEVRDGIHL